jgi:hypothetical protein
MDVLGGAWSRLQIVDSSGLVKSGACCGSLGPVWDRLLSTSIQLKPLKLPNRLILDECPADTNAPRRGPTTTTRNRDPGSIIHSAHGPKQKNPLNLREITRNTTALLERVHDPFPSRHPHSTPRSLRSPHEQYRPWRLGLNPSCSPARDDDGPAPERLRWWRGTFS